MTRPAASAPSRTRSATPPGRTLRSTAGRTAMTGRPTDCAGNLLSSTDRNGGVTNYTYDDRGNVLTRTDPQIDPQTPRFVTTFEYDPSNNLTRVIDAKNFVTTHTYD